MSDQSAETDRPDPSGKGRRDAAGRQRPERKHGNLQRSVTRPAERLRSTDPARLGMRGAPHAAVDQSVGLARLVNGASAGRFVNAVMRRISEKDLDTWIEQVVPRSEEH